ncbi:MYND finger domain-containing protein [Colletotrichum plurivorum]|uniref:MYND finger domain-containing protein n=1 Tax=Colletotrichum plurivorum TaxID=2175906 RepID=A0A8H6NRZ2_9PEZI|nr:MYND finger domain-containing protein [Colletotrichum plurivorum]
MGGELRLTELVHQSDMLAPPESKEYYKTDSYRDVLSHSVLQKQAKFNAGNTATKLLEKFRAKQHEPNGKYRVIIVGALIMRTGATLRETDIQYLRHLTEQVDCKPGYAPAYDDAGFRGPGKA